MKDLLLFAAIAALIVAVAYFGVSNAKRMDEVAEGVGRVEKLLNDFIPTIDGRIANAVKEGLEGVDGRVADKVLERLLQEGLCLSKGSCGVGARAPMESNFVLFHENARLDSDDSLNEDSYGIRLTDEHKTRLDGIASAFAPCARPPDHAVEFKVSGHSSTAKFKMLPLDDSNRLNLDAANLRAKVVADYLEGNGFTANWESWTSYDAIRRPYLDNSKFLSGETTQETLNRSVFIQVADAGACDNRERSAANP